VTKYLTWIGFAGLSVLIGVNCLALLAPWIWQGEMINPFRLQILLVATLGLGFSLWLRRMVLIILAAMTFILSALPVGLALIHQAHVSKTVAPHQGQLSLVSVNVLCDNYDHQAVLNMARTQNADLLVAIETSPHWIKGLEPLKALYPYSYSPDKGIFGISLYAKQPFTGRLIGVSGTPTAIMIAEFDRFVVIAAHPMPPATARLTQYNRVYLQKLARLIQAQTKPVILAGDLNATPWSYNLTPVLKAGVQWPKGSGFAYSWPAQKPWLAIQIDHVFTKGFTGATYTVLPNVGSDHFPVRADLIF
jgi:vancomycin resistance protein VanJ